MISAMTPAKAHRGRPKGTGIDDQPKLLEIARLVSADPRMKPTTAIKAIGITDPSTIRRLRDKFNLSLTTLPAITATTPPVIRPTAKVISLVLPVTVPMASPVEAAPVTKPEVVRTSEPLPPIEMGHGLAALLPASSAKTDSMPVAAMFLGFGLTAATALFEQQMMFAQNLMKLPPVRDMVRNQLAFTQFMLSVARPSPGPRLAH
jgi:hypothetical protein